MSRHVYGSLRGLSAVVLSLAALALGACHSLDAPGDEEFLSSEPLTVAEFDDIWERARIVLRGEAYAIDDEGTRRRDREIVTRWLVSLAPTRFEGKRRRAFVRLVEMDNGKWLIRVAVQQQRNADLDAPLSPINAKWEAEEVDAGRAEILLFKIEHAFRPPPAVGE